jgi:SAM-dependent methyltransferase
MTTTLPDRPAGPPAGPPVHPPVNPLGILRLGTAFWGSKALLSAVELGVFTALAAAPATEPELRERLGLHPRSARDFLDALVALGMLDREGDRYANTAETGLFLDRTKPSYLGGFLEMANDRLFGFWGRLTEALHTGRPQNEARDGEDFFATLYADPVRLREFMAAMNAASGMMGTALARAFPWAEVGSFVDVGGAQGGVAAHLVRAHPHLSGGVFDLPPVEPVFAEHVNRLDLAGAMRFHPGDFFADPLPAADVLLLGHVLHDWDAAQNRALVRSAYDAVRPGGALLVYDAMIDDARRENVFGLLLSLNMLIETEGGGEYTAADCRSWLRDAGFVDVHAQPLTPTDTVVIGRKPG